MIRAAVLGVDRPAGHDHTHDPHHRAHHRDTTEATEEKQDDVHQNPLLA
jgi:hypothetical protein